MTLRHNTVRKEAVHILLGIHYNSTKEIIDYSIVSNESKINWKEVIESTNRRNVTQVALFITNGLNTMEEVISSIYPLAKIQRCLLHVNRNIPANVASVTVLNYVSGFQGHIYFYRQGCCNK